MTVALTFDEPRPAFDYRSGLSRHREAVISSHFMEAIARDTRLQLYDDARMRQDAWRLDAPAIDDVLSILRDAARRFGAERGAAAVVRAAEQHQAYSVACTDNIGEAEVIAEVMFDRQFTRKANATCARAAVRDRIAAGLRHDRIVRMAIPALPFKIRSPLKSRGDLPDLAEVGFLLSLYEVALAVEVASACVAPNRAPVSAQFVVVSDGSRFATLAHMPEEAIAGYRHALRRWIARLGLERHVVLDDYRELLDRKLPTDVAASKARIAAAARTDYREALAPVFDPDAVEQALARSRAIEPDPEAANVQGRFGALLRSLVYTIDYRTLAALNVPKPVRAQLYREITAHLFAPLKGSVVAGGRSIERETLRRAMLAEVWDATIAYLAEIKSDRDLAEDPMLTCIPGAVRWTIHAKAGQFAMVTPSYAGAMVQPWAGAGVFRPTEKGAIRLCAYPALGLEGVGAIPVLAAADADGVAPQPLFYVDAKLAAEGPDAFREALGHRLTRRRLS